MSDSATTSGEPDVEQIKDVQDLKQRRKLKALLDAEETVREMRKKAKLGERQGTSVGVVGYRAAVEDYLLALRPIIKEKNEALWANEELGELTVHPPSIREFFQDLPDSELTQDGTPRYGTVRGHHQLTPQTLEEFHGLQSLLDAPSQFSATWTIDYWPASGGKDPRTKTRRVDLPRNIVDAAYELAADFADEHGFGFETDSERPFNDYS